MDRLSNDAKEAVLRRLSGRFAHLPLTVSLAEELIAERRVASQGEGAACADPSEYRLRPRHRRG